MRAWIDLTNSPHVLVLRPVIDELRARGWDVEVTARDFAQTIGLAERLGIEHTVIGHHRGDKLAAKARGLVDRSAALARWARPRGFDLAIGHGSNDVTLAARALRIPRSSMFDYEFATIQHGVNGRLGRAHLVVPDAIPAERLKKFGPRKRIHTFPGLKEEYYLADFEPDPGILDELGLDASRPIAVVRTPPVVSLYHRFENDLFGQVLRKLQGTQSIVLPRVASQKAEIRELGFTVPEQAIDAQSLIAHADLVVSAGGTMNREAVALGTPVWTTFEGTLGGVDEHLIATGRLRKLESPDDLELVKRDGATSERVRRDPGHVVDLLLNALG